MSDNTYHGWTNYETWLANLEFGSDWADAEDKDGTKYESYGAIATAMRDVFEEVMFDGCSSEYARQWVAISTSKINWFEIAEHCEFLLDGSAGDDEPPGDTGGGRRYGVVVRLRSGDETREHHYLGTDARRAVTLEPDMARTWFAMAAAAVLANGGVSRPSTPVEPTRWPTMPLPEDGLITSITCDMPNGDEMEIRLIGEEGGDQ